MRDGAVTRGAIPGSRNDDANGCLSLFIALTYKVASTMECAMPIDTSDLDQLQGAYKAAVEEWIAAIKLEEELTSVNHSIAEIDKWEAAHFKEDEVRGKVLELKKEYEDALRKEQFGF
ncbi:hypothetical protein [Mesorhizobium sp. M7D.F.Ca.US.005.01.1.1]|uniref:hypothetical protein n=1 Tax=Mesorhizobium sp. M7D.F.Ca.US.005.01.1.1 TaxID=2493678 RepID=UPI001FE1559D|nr:hypothetical protein [Mesorhizobium sp. M7D.F.Ca.US.005.01.1.1]